VRREGGLQAGFRSELPVFCTCMKPEPQTPSLYWSEIRARMREREAISKPIYSLWQLSAGVRPRAGFSESLILLSTCLRTPALLFVSFEECSSYNHLIAREWA